MAVRTFRADDPSSFYRLLSGIAVWAFQCASLPRETDPHVQNARSRPSWSDCLCGTVACGDANWTDRAKSWTSAPQSGSLEGMPDTQINPTAAPLLRLLHEGPMTGGQLMAAAERRLGPYWSMTRSQVYRELPVLAEMGYVRLGKPGPRSSQPYAITAAGKRAFSRWLAESPGRDAIRNPVALRVAFGQQHSGNQLKTLYTGANEYHSEALAMAREQAKEAKKAGDAYGAAAPGFSRPY